MRIGRREFLKGTIGVSAAMLMDGMPFSRALVRATGLPNPGESGLDHVLVLMMENRSTDHYLGWLPGIDGWRDRGPAPDGVFAQPRGLAGLPRDGTAECPSTLAAPDTTTLYESYRMTRHCHVPDPDHGWYGSRAQFNHGAMNGFVHATPDPEAEQALGTDQHIAMGMFAEDDLPFTAWVARNYTTFSNYFCSVMGPTYPNRYYLHSGQSAGERGNRFGPAPDGWTWPTIWERLDEAGVDWAYYFVDLPVIGLWFHLVRKHPGRIRHIESYFADALAGRLPQVAYLDPGFVAGFDDHPASDVKRGQRFLYDVSMALVDSPQWPSSALIVTYDEHGGFFDHVPPPQVYDPLASTSYCDNFGQLGFRVPTTVLSPFTAGGVVAGGGAPYDHASVLKLIEWRFGVGPCSTNVAGTGLPSRDAMARNLADVFNFDAPPAIGLPSEPPPPDVHAGGLTCGYIPTDEPAALIHEEHAVEDALHGLPPVAPPFPTRLVPTKAQQAHRELIELADTGWFGRFDLRHVPVEHAFR